MDALKSKAISEYEWLLEKLFKGKKEKYDHLLNLIHFIELPLTYKKELEFEQFILASIWHTPCHNPLRKDKDDVEVKLPNNRSDYNNKGMKHGFYYRN